MQFEASFQKECGNDDKCDSKLILKATTDLLLLNSKYQVKYKMMLFEFPTFYYGKQYVICLIFQSIKYYILFITENYAKQTYKFSGQTSSYAIFCNKNNM